MMRTAIVLLALVSGHCTLGAAVQAQEPSVFEVVVLAAQLDAPVGFIGPEIKTIGQFMGGLTAHVDGSRCVQTSTTTGGDAVLRIGLPGQPAACMVEGATVTFVDGSCRQLASQAVLRKGTRVTLTNLAPAPPGPAITDCAPPTPRPATSPAAATPQVQPSTSATPVPEPPPGGITPPSTGDAGLLER